MCISRGYLFHNVHLYYDVQAEAQNEKVKAQKEKEKHMKSEEKVTKTRRIPCSVLMKIHAKVNGRKRSFEWHEVDMNEEFYLYSNRMHDVNILLKRKKKIFIFILPNFMMCSI